MLKLPLVPSFIEPSKSFPFIVTDNFSFLFKSITSKLSVMLSISSCVKISFFWLMVFKLKLQEDVGILKSTPFF